LIFWISTQNLNKNILAELRVLYWENSAYLQDILQPDPDMRMNANGVLEFLDGICKPAQFADDSYKQPHTAQILPGMSEAELAKILQADAILAPLLELMNRGTAKYQQAIKKIQGLPQCPQE
jgi:hypothetical protein